MGWYQRRVHGEFPSNLNSKQSAESQLLLLQRGYRTQFSLTTKLFSLLLKPPSQRPNNQQEPINHCRYGRLKDQTELPRGVRSAHQQADQHGVLCVIRLSFNGLLLRPGRHRSAWLRRPLQDRVRGGKSSWHEDDGLPEPKRRKGRLPRHCQAQLDGVGITFGRYGGRP